MGKKEIDATKKKGMALSDDALAGVTGGKTYYAYESYRPPGDGSLGRQIVTITTDRSSATRKHAPNGGDEIVECDYDGDEQGARDYYNTLKSSTAFERIPVSVAGFKINLADYDLHEGWF